MVELKIFNITHGTTIYSVRFLSTFFDDYGIDRQYDQKKIRLALRNSGFWINDTGDIIIRPSVLKDYRRPRK